MLAAATDPAMIGIVAATHGPLYSARARHLRPVAGSNGFQGSVARAHLVAVGSRATGPIAFLANWRGLWVTASTMSGAGKTKAPRGPFRSCLTKRWSGLAFSPMCAKNRERIENASRGGMLATGKR